MASDLWPGYCRALLAASIASAAKLFPGRGEAAPERVHSVRKTLKESRALARLFLKSVGEPARVSIASLAVIRRRVGQARDLDVMEARLGRLEPPPDIAEPLRAAIARDRAAAGRAHTALAARTARTQLTAIGKRIEALDLSDLADSDIVDAVTRTYRQARERGRIAFDCDDPAALHALRSRVVDLRYQLAALSPAWPAALSAQADELNELRDTLGDFNDFHVLYRYAGERAGLSTAALSALGERVEAKQKKLRRKAHVEFERLFVEPPAAFSLRLAVWMKRPMEAPRAESGKGGAPTQPTSAG